MSIAAYQQTMAECEDPRRIEYLVFLRITLDLEANRDAGWRSAALKDALWRNLELWNTLRADLLEDGNALPEALRAGLVSLSFSVARRMRPHTSISQNTVAAAKKSFSVPRPSEPGWPRTVSWPRVAAPS